MALELLSAARNTSSIGGGNLARFKSSIKSFVSQGRPGFPKPLAPPGRIGLSQSSRQQLSGFLNGGVQLFNNLLAIADTGQATNQTQILALRAQAGDRVASFLRPEEPSRGSSIDTSA